ncbi:MAG TPA: GntR family transcriptional regulator [Desulfopila sp.]|nr:GntR family transcriptional regulator [Desulfopila sp.]
MAGKIVKVPSLKEQVYLYLKNAIVTSELALETTYSEKWVADRLEVSRTPVREAVLQLQQENFIEVLPYKGFKVKRLSLEDVRDTFQIRLALEGFCVIHIAQNIHLPAVSKVLDALDTCLDKMSGHSGEDGVHSFVEQDARFHRHIIDYANNERLISMYNDIRYRFERITLRVLTNPGRMQGTVAEHRRIAERIREGRAWEAYQAIQEHLHETQKIMELKSAEKR